MPKHVFFDLDNTLMLSRTVMAPRHQSAFLRLCQAKDVIVVSGAQESQIKTQIPDRIGATYYILAQMGNYAVHKSGSVLWRESLSEEQTKATRALIQTIHDELDLPVKNEDDLVEDRGSQISYSLIGHHETLEKKYAFDPGNEKRLRILEQKGEAVAALRSVGIDIVPGGTTCLDFFLDGRTKGYNVIRLIEREGWGSNECLYIGDALFPGGNDGSVIGVIPTRAIKDPDETFDVIKSDLLL
jgi:phosphomannomutase